jgi:hypothetical protein
MISDGVQCGDIGHMFCDERAKAASYGAGGNDVFRVYMERSPR